MLDADQPMELLMLSTPCGRRETVAENLHPNVAKSTYSPGPGPKSATRTYVADGAGYKFTSVTVDASGKSSTVTFTTHLDGKYTPMIGSTAADSIKVERAGANGTTSTQTKAGKVVNRTTRTMAKDGKSFTSTNTGTNADGKATKNVELYEKK
jgi:hypothetical protein